MSQVQKGGIEMKVFWDEKTVKELLFLLEHLEISKKHGWRICLHRHLFYWQGVYELHGAPPCLAKGEFIRCSNCALARERDASRGG